MAFTINQDTVLFVWFIDNMVSYSELAGFIKNSEETKSFTRQHLWRYQTRDTGMIELLIVDKKAIRDDTSF